jgi:hypothetical protein
VTATSTTTTLEKPNNSNNNNSNNNNKASWQDDLDQLLEPTTSFRQRQLLLQDLLSANGDIRSSVEAALRDRKVRHVCVMRILYTRRRNPVLATAVHPIHPAVTLVVTKDPCPVCRWSQWGASHPTSTRCCFLPPSQPLLYYPSSYDSFGANLTCTVTTD